MPTRPRIQFLADRPRRAQARAARAIARCLADEFDCRVRFESDAPDLRDEACDLLYVASWDNAWFRQFEFEPQQVVKSVGDHRWGEASHGAMTAREFAATWLADAGTITCCSERLQRAIAPHRSVALTPLGYDPFVFPAHRPWRGSLRLGWAGDTTDPTKGLERVLIPAAGDEFDLRIATGDPQLATMGEFYRSIDVFTIASAHEGAPLTLIEAMASGCFPVCVNVGIVPELIDHGETGLIVPREPEAFRAAFEWCAANPDFVRRAGLVCAERMRRRRTWQHVAERWREMFRAALSVVRRSPAAQASNDDLVTRVDGMIRRLPLQLGDTLLDLGGGLQELRDCLPTGVGYRVGEVDELVGGTRRELHRAITLIDTAERQLVSTELIEWAAANTEFAVVAFDGGETGSSPPSFVEFEAHLRALGTTLLEVANLGPTARAYSLAFPTARARHLDSRDLAPVARSRDDATATRVCPLS